MTLTKLLNKNEVAEKINQHPSRKLKAYTPETAPRECDAYRVRLELAPDFPGWTIGWINDEGVEIWYSPNQHSLFACDDLRRLCEDSKIPYQENSDNNTIQSIVDNGVRMIQIAGRLGERK